MHSDQIISSVGARHIMSGKACFGVRWALNQPAFVELMDSREFRCMKKCVHVLRLEQIDGATLYFLLYRDKHMFTLLDWMDWFWIKLVLNWIGWICSLEW